MSRLTPEEALSRLQPQGLRKAKGKVTTTFSHTLNDSLYVFKQGKGGLILPADDICIPLLGEFETMTDTMPPAMELWMQSCSDEITEADFDNLLTKKKVTSIKKAASTTTKSMRKDVDALVKYNWGQTKPFNQNLKMGDNGTLCVTGCTATAIAEIMAYWASIGYHRGCKATPKYTTATKKYAVDSLPALTVFDYKNFTTGKPTTTKTKAAVAQLMEYIGKACKSDYESGGTGAYTATAVTALKNLLRMGNDIKLIKALNNYDAWEEKVYNEIANGRPVLLGGYNNKKSGGHAFVCDGYRTSDDKYHYNWGWNGSYNGWYAMTALTPNSHNYSYYKDAVIGILPAYKLGDADGNGIINVSDVVAVLNDVVAGKSTKQTDINSSGKTTKADADILIDEILNGGVL